VLIYLLIDVIHIKTKENQMNTYEPNFNDPRVIRRCRKAIGFTKALVSSTKPTPMSTRFIDKHYGISSNKLSKYLRDLLLVCVDDSFNMDSGETKKYIYSVDGMNFLVGSLGLKKGNNHHTTLLPSVLLLRDEALNWANETYEEQLNSLEFDYEEKSHRLFNPIQNIRSETRTELLASHGLSHQYDIVCAAPTLLYQYSFMVPEATGEVLETLEHYLKHRSAVRYGLAKEAEITQHQAKQIINALFAGAHLSTYESSALFKLIDYDVAKMKFLQQHPYLTSLRMDIKTMWDVIKCVSPVEYFITKTGKKRKRPFNAKSKWNIYFQLERRILEEVKTYMKEIDSKYFLEHDGFTSQKEINPQDLSWWIEAGTDFKLKLEKK
jgi:hypothetical protein